jgi:hypothetical protein
MKRSKEENSIRKLAFKKKNKALRNYYVWSKISILVFILMLNVYYTKSTQEVKESIQTNSKESILQEYSFADIGIFIDPFSWNGKGQFHISENKTFDLNNNGPCLLVLDFISEGDKPDSPGYEIVGSFNQIAFTASITRDMLSTEDDFTVRQIAIPLAAEGRIYGNNFLFNISCSNEQSDYNSGELTICESSQLYVGDSLLIDSYGSFSSAIYPNELNGMASLGGIKMSSFVQITVDNETLVENADYQITLEILYEGDISLSAILYDEIDNVYVFDKNETSTNTLITTSKFQTKKGVNYCKIEFSVYSGSIWSTSFNISITSCNIFLKESQGGFGFGFGDLEIPFFQWPSVPIVGVIVLLLWAMPYSILKYREWKKLPDEIEVSILEDEEFNILDPEGLTGDEDDDEFNETYDVMEDD